MGFQTHDLRDSGATLYQLSYEASLEARPFFATALVAL